MEISAQVNNHDEAKGNEIWKDIDGYDGLYQISNLGRVQSFRGNTPRIMKAFNNGKNQSGYLSINLSYKGQRTPYLIHRLVAKAFIPNPDNLPQVNHKDENRLNNNADNLEWCGSAYNNSYGTFQERRKTKISRKVGKFNLNDELLSVYPSAREAARQNNVDQGGISLCCRGCCKTYKGLKWKYL